MTTSEHDPYQILADLYRSKQFRECIEQAHLLIAANPADPRPHFEIGRCAVSLKEYELARDEFLTVAQIDPDYNKITNWLGLAESKLGRTMEAIAYFETTLGKHPDSAFALEHLARLTYKAEDYASSVSYAQRCLELKGDNHIVQCNLGDALCSLDRVDEGLIHYRAATQIAPDNARNRVALGVALYRTHKRSEAMQQYLEAIKLEPSFSEARHCFGDALYDLQDYKGAIEQWREALRLGHSESSHLELDIVRALVDRKRYRDASKVLDKLDQVEPNNVETLLFRGLIRAHARDVDGAIRLFRKAIELQPGHSYAHCPLGFVLILKARRYRSPERWIAARESLDRSLALSPDNPNAKIGMSRVMWWTGSRQEAIQYLGRLVALYPNDNGLPYRLLSMFCESLKFKQAFELLKTLAAREYRKAQAASDAKEQVVLQ